jgi:outer membrane protein
MKNIQWVLNILFAIILGYLLVGEFNSNEDKSVISEEVNTDAEIDESGLVIRYINSDSLYKKFDLVADLRENIDRKQQEYSATMELRAKAFEQEVISFQQNAQSMSQFEGQQKQKELLAEEQELGEMQQELSNKLIEMDNKMQLEIREAVLKYLEKYKNQGVDYVLDYSSNGSVLKANNTDDITNAVVDSLNVIYSNQKAIK